MTRKKHSLLLFILSTSLLLGACTPTTKTTPINLETESPNVTLTGNLTQAGNRFSLTSTGQAPIELDSRKVDLSSYAGKTVTVTGQYSGTTLFIDKIE